MAFFFASFEANVDAHFTSHKSAKAVSLLYAVVVVVVATAMLSFGTVLLKLCGVLFVQFDK